MANILIYTTPACPWCHKTKEFLKQNKIKYTEKDVAANRKNAEEMVKKSKQMGVPVLDLGGKIIVGYDPEGIIQTLAKGKQPAKKTATKASKKKRI